MKTKLRLSYLNRSLYFTSLVYDCIQLFHHLWQIKYQFMFINYVRIIYYYCFHGG